MNTALLPGLRGAKIIDKEPRKSPTHVQSGRQIAHVIRIQPWTELEKNVNQQRVDVQEFLQTSGCRPRSHNRSYRCDGTFRVRTCESEICRRLATYKANMHEWRPYRNKMALLCNAMPCFEALLKLSNQLDPHTNDSNDKRELDMGENVGQSQSCFPDCCVSNRRVVKADREHDIYANISIELRCPTDAENLLQPPAAGRHVADKYDQHFKDRRKRVRSGEPALMDWHHKALVQCIGSALTTDTGYGVLYTHNSMLAIQVVPTEFQNMERDAEVKVKMSKIYKCDDESASALHGLLALFREAAGNARSETRDKLVKLRHQIDCLKEARYCVIGHKGNSQSAGSLAVGGKQLRKSGRLSARRARSANEDTLDVPEERTEGFVYGYEYVEETHEETEMVRRAIAEGGVLELCKSDLERLFVSHWTGWREGGAFGYVIRACVVGVDVVIKRWNWTHPGGIEHLEDEIRVYRTVRERNPDLLGDVMPQMFAVVKEPREESALVLEHVGSKIVHKGARKEKVACGEKESLSVDEDESEGSVEIQRGIAWDVDGVRLDERDEMEITEAATESLRKLWRCGISHDDLRYPNLRVKRIRREGGGSRGWRAWWIDFGRAEICEMDSVRLEKGHLYRRLRNGGMWKLGAEVWCYKK